MSKIQQALNKMRARKTISAATGSSRIAQAVQRDSVSVPEFAVSKPLAAHAHDAANLRPDKMLVVDRTVLLDAGLIAPESQARLLADQYRDIKRPLIAHAFGKHATQVSDGNLIMITSALAGEGKTFTSINLALSMSQEKDHTILLVDADVAKPHISDIFGAADERGLLDLLEDHALSPESVILPTDVEGLSMLPAGRPRPNATELLASSRMDVIIAHLGSRSPGCITLFDSPPILQTSEAKVITSMVGQIVLVVWAEVTAQGAVSAAIASIGEDKAISLLLNQARSSSTEYQYGYGSAYRYSRDANATGMKPPSDQLRGR